MPGGDKGMTDAKPTTAVSPGELSSRTAPSDRRPPRAEPCLRCLVTNDDGIASPGIAALARVAVDAGLEVVVAAPLRDTSGASASITAVEEDGRFVVEHYPLPGLEGCDTYGVGGLPAFIALTGCRGAFGPVPDIVLSGINHGPNTGFAVLHSGTVGAALTASTHGARAMAVSLHSGAHIRVPHHAGTPHWETAAELARRVLPTLMESPPRTVFNLNVPNVALDEVRGLRPARLATFGAVQFNVVEKGEGYAKIGLSEMEADLEPGTDAALVADGWATLTALQAVCQADGVVNPA